MTATTCCWASAPWGSARAADPAYRPAKEAWPYWLAKGRRDHTASIPAQPLLLGSSPMLYTYFARFYRYGDQLLLNHHTVPRQTLGDVYLAPLKTVHRDDSGILSLRWWPGNEALKGASRLVALEACSFHGIQAADCSIQDDRLQLATAAGGLAILPVHHDVVRGVVVEAELTVYEASNLLSGAGLFIEGEAANTGTLLLLQHDGHLAVGPYNGYAFKPEDRKPLALPPGVPAPWRLLLRDRHLELYVRDELVQCYTMPHAPHGRLGFVVEAGTATVASVRIWDMSL